jgi:hypothetical protein
MTLARSRGTTPDPVKVGVSGVVAAWTLTAWSFPSLLRLIDQIRGMWEKVRSRQTSLSVPSASILLYIAQRERAHNHELVGAPDQSARQNGSPFRWRSRWGSQNQYSPPQPKQLILIINLFLNLAPTSS